MCVSVCPTPGQHQPSQTHLEEEAKDSQPVGMPLGLCQRLVLDIHVDDVQLWKAQRDRAWAELSAVGCLPTDLPGQPEGTQPDTEPAASRKALSVPWVPPEGSARRIKAPQ